MNYINKLQVENQQLNARIRSVNEEINNFRAFLFSDKFQGYDKDGGRKDWIATTDVDAKMAALKFILNEENPHDTLMRNHK